MQLARIGCEITTVVLIPTGIIPLHINLCVTVYAYGPVATILHTQGGTHIRQNVFSDALYDRTNEIMASTLALEEAQPALNRLMKLKSPVPLPVTVITPRTRGFGQGGGTN